ncbi:MAG: hypothetical protein WDN45_03025 [Caulobacteraceae bacterium]
MGKFYGQFDPPVDRVLFERYFPDKTIRGVFVECGAYDGQTESCCKFFENRWTGGASTSSRSPGSTTS